MSKSKRCARCQETKPRADFSRNASTADGLGAYCRACKRESDRRSRRGGAAAEEAPAEVERAPRGRPRVSPPEAENSTPTKRKPWARSTITESLIEAICVPLRKGHSRRVAARVAGLDESTLSVWMVRGRESKEPDSPTRQLYEAVTEAEGVGLSSLEEKALAGAEIDHVQALRLLERRDPETWARREVKPTAETGQNMEIADVRKLLAERLTRYLSGPEAPPTEGATGAPDVGGASGVDREPAG